MDERIGNLLVGEAELVAPHRARLWRVHASSSAFVSKGQQIASLLDCENTLVVATVPERVFNRLAIGGGATFEMNTTGERYRGHVVQMAGRTSPTGEDVLVAREGWAAARTAEGGRG